MSALSYYESPEFEDGPFSRSAFDADIARNERIAETTTQLVAAYIKGDPDFWQSEITLAARKAFLAVDLTDEMRWKQFQGDILTAMARQAKTLAEDA